MARRRCIFCGGRPLTGEHVVSRWAYDVVAKDSRQLDSESEHVRFNPDGSQQVWRSKNPVDFVANCVCSACNAGWMSDIESHAKPVIAQMVANQMTALDLESQDAVAAWLGLKAIVERYTHGPILPVRRDWIEYYYEHHRPPNTWQIHICRYVGSLPVYISGGDITTLARHNLVPFAVERPAVLFSIGIGYFFGQVIGVDHQTAIARNWRLFRQVWPHPLLRLVLSHVSNRDLVSWPAERSLSDADLERHSRDVTQSPDLSLQPPP